MAKYSFIIPAYNAEHTIIKCLDSISAQEVDDYEVLVVNDGSTDNTAVCVADYAQNNHRVHLYSKANGGVSSARNYGIDLATGDYIIFVDADDYISGDYLLLSEQHMGYDWTIFAFWEKENLTGGKTEQVFLIAAAMQQCIFPYIADGAQDLESLCLSTPWSKVYSSRIIKENHLHFNEQLVIGEDAFFNLEYLKYVQTVFCINKKVYYYCDNSSSATRKFNKNCIITDMAYQQAIYDFLHHSPYNNLDLHRLLSAMNGVLHCIGGYFGHRDNHKGVMESYREMKVYLSNTYFYEDFEQYKPQLKAVFGGKKFFLLLWLKSQRFIFLLNLSMMCLRVLRRIR